MKVICQLILFLVITLLECGCGGQCKDVLRQRDKPCIPQCIDILEQSGNIANADLRIDSISFREISMAGHIKCRIYWSYFNDDCAISTRVIVLLPSNLESGRTVLVDCKNGPGEDCEIISSTNGVLLIFLGDICPNDNIPDNGYFDLTLKSKIKNISAFIFSETEDAFQCNNFKHFSRD